MTAKVIDLDEERRRRQAIHRETRVMTSHSQWDEIQPDIAEVFVLPAGYRFLPDGSVWVGGRPERFRCEPERFRCELTPDDEYDDSDEDEDVRE